MTVTTDHRTSQADRTPLEISPEVRANLQQVLTTLRTHLGMDVAFVSEFLGANRIFQAVDTGAPISAVETGAVLPMAAGYCRHVVAGMLPELMPDTSAVPLARSIDETRTIPIGAHLSVPIETTDGRIFGTFCCFSHAAKPGLGPSHLELVRTLSRLIAQELSQEVRRLEREAGRMHARHALMNNGRPMTLAELLKAAPPAR